MNMTLKLNHYQSADLYAILVRYVDELSDEQEKLREGSKASDLIDERLDCINDIIILMERLAKEGKDADTQL